jgi:hypothetical protein
MGLSTHKSNSRRVLANNKVAAASSTNKQKADLVERSTSLYRRIQGWRKTQLSYTPFVARLLPNSGSDNDGDTQQPESTPLYLPSALPRRAHSDIRRALEIETRLRVAQADDSLAEIQRLRRVITGLWQFKKLNLSGEGNKPNTRVRTTHNRLQAKIQHFAARYQAARLALSQLDPEGAWQGWFLELKDMDISGPGKEDGNSNGHYVLSWIWLVPHSTDSARPIGGVDPGADSSQSSPITEAELDQSLRVEWAKSKARMLRWKEEYQLVQEEMRRVIAYFEWQGDWWRRLVPSIGRLQVTDDVVHGLSAYAHKQAAYSDCLGNKARAYWSPALAKMGLAPEWAVAEGNTEEVDEEEEADDADEGGSDIDDDEVLAEVSGSMRSDLDTDDFDLFELED